MGLRLNLGIGFACTLLSFRIGRRSQITRKTLRVVSVYLIKEIEKTSLMLSKGNYIVVVAAVVRVPTGRLRLVVTQ